MKTAIMNEAQRHHLIQERTISSIAQGASLQRVEEAMRSVIQGGGVDLMTRMALDQLSSGGKRLRALLALETGRAMGANDEDTIWWAAAVELLHNATLIHDDIQDQDRTRRGNPTLWSEYGEAQAINAGDFMLMLPFVCLAKVTPKFVGPLSLLLAQVATEVARGQSLELSLPERNELSTECYWRAAEGKTGALFSLPVVGAAMLADRPSGDVSELNRVFGHLGVLFQIQDDVIDLFGEKGRKDKGSDIREGKVTALVVEQVKRAPETRAELLSVLKKPREQTSDEDVATIEQLYRKSGTLNSILTELCQLREQIENSALVQSEPSLKAMCRGLIQRAFGPLSTLFTKEWDAAE
jgi:geranylgeranyl diphosphate synthase type I